MRPALCCATALWAIASLAPAAPAARAARAERAPRIDGTLDDACWAKAAPQSRFALLGSKKQATQQTQFRVCFDDKKLYVACECREQQMDKLVAAVRRREGNVWEDDCVEVFLAPAADRTRYYHFVANSLGTRRDERGKDGSWDSGWRARAQRGQGAWTAELAIPFDALELTSDAASPWGINVTRNERPRGELSTWAPLPGNSFHEPARFGVLEGVTADVTRHGIRTLRDRVERVQRASRGPARLAKRHERRSDFGKELFGQLVLLRIDTDEVARAARGEPDLAALARLERRCAAAEARLAHLTAQAARLQLLAAMPHNGPEAAFALCQESTLRKVQPDKPYGGTPARKVALALARNEHEAAQVVVVPGRGALEGVAASCSALEGPDGSKIGREQITLNLVGYVDVTRSSGRTPCKPGRYPDPLLPLAPFGVPEAEVRSLWLTAHARPDQPAGLYRGELTVAAVGASPVRMPVEVKVWDFALPTTPRLRTSYGMSAGHIGTRHGVSMGSHDMPGWTFGTWTGADTRGIANYFGKGEFEGTYDETAKHSGARSAHIACTASQRGTHESPRACYYTQPITLEADTTYVLSVWYRTKGVKPNEAYVWGPGIQGIGMAPSADWRQAVVTFTPKKSVQTRVYLGLRAVGEVWWDDLELREQRDGARSLVRNGSFDEGAPGEGQRLLREYRLNALRHRISPTNVGSPRVDVKDDKVTIDWTDFDRRMEEYVRHGLSAFNVNWCRVRGGWGKVGEMKDPKEAAIASELLRQTQKHLAEKGWLHLAYIYAIDEPSAKFFPQVKAAFGLVRRGAPKLKTLLTYGYGATRPWKPGTKGLPAYAALAGLVDIHVPHSDCIHPAYLAQRRTAGDETWAYVCISAQEPYANNWGIDFPGSDPRVLFWQLWQHGITGFLYWQATYWKADVWTDPLSYPGGNGDGSLLYPGKGGPVNSIRWETNRDGIEDYGLLCLLRERADALAKAHRKRSLVRRARRLLDLSQISKSWTQFTRDPAVVEQRRAEIGDLLEAVTQALR